MICLQRKGIPMSKKQTTSKYLFLKAVPPQPHPHPTPHQCFLGAQAHTHSASVPNMPFLSRWPHFLKPPAPHALWECQEYLALSGSFQLLLVFNLL